MATGGDSSTSPGEIVTGVSIAVVAVLLVVAVMCRLCQGYRTSREHAAAGAAALAARPPEHPAAGYWDDDEQEARGRSTAQRGRSSRRASLPSFAYNPLSSVKHNVTGGSSEEAACSVCLGAFQAGETVRLLPVCLHLYHVECIDPWLDAHSTCPICRSGTDPTTMEGVVDG